MTAGQQRLGNKFLWTCFGRAVAVGAIRRRPPSDTSRAFAEPSLPSVYLEFIMISNREGIQLANDMTAMPVRGADELTSPRLRDLYVYWERRRDGAHAMPRSALDATDLAATILPYMAVLEVLSGARDFQYRLVGTGITDIVGRDFTGETVSSFGQRHEDDRLKIGYQEVVRTGQPQRYEGDLRNVGRELVTYERLALPMTSDDSTIDQLLVGFVFHEPNRPKL